MRLGLQRKLVLLVVPLVVAPLAVLAWLAWAGLEESSRSRLLNELAERMEDVDEDVRTATATARTNLALFALGVPLRNYLATGDENIRAQLLYPQVLESFLGYLEAYPEYDEVRLVLPDGYEDVRAAREGLDNVTEDESDNPVVKALAASRQGTFVALLPNPDAAGRLTLYLGTRLTTVERGSTSPGEAPRVPAGYLIVAINTAFLQGLVEREQVGASARLALVDDAGRMLYRPRNAPFDDAAIADALPRPRAAMAAAGPVRLTLASGTALASVRGIEHGLYVVGVLPEAEYLAEARTVVRYVAAVLVVTLGVTVILLLRSLDWTVVQPLRRLGEAAARIGAGDLDTPVGGGGNDEIAELAGVLDGMRSELAASRAEQERSGRELAAYTAQLAIARDEAEAASRAKSEFLANMSHELRTPLNGLIGFSELLLMSDLAEPQRRQVQTIRASGEALLALINDVLELAQLEAGRAAAHNAPFEIAGLLEAIATQFAPVAAGKGLELVFDVPPALPARVVGDRGRLRQVLTVLVGNAIKFTREGAVTLRLGATPAFAGTIDLRVEVEDTGIGIPAQAQAHLFEAFFQADGSSTRAQGGLGLGLAVAQRLVNLMGARLEYDSVAGTGTRFRFTLSLPVASESPLAAPSAALAAPGSILVAGGHAATRDALLGMLGGLGLPAGAVDAAALHARLRGGPPVAAVVLAGGDAGIDASGWPAQPDGTRPAIVATVAPGGTAPPSAPPGIVVVPRPLLPGPFADALARAVAARAASVTPLAPVPAAPAGRRVRVLVAEDSAVNQRLIAAMLGRIGAEVTVVGDGLAAVEAVAASLAAARYDLLLLDYQMPGLDGLQAAARIRALEAERHVTPAHAIVAITANVMPGDRETCLAAGMDDYLPKPYTYEQLAAVVARWTGAGDAPARRAL